MNAETIETQQSAPLNSRFNRRRAAVVGAAAFLLSGLVGRGRGAQAAAQEATPESTGMTMEGVTLEPIAFGITSKVPPAPAAFQLARMRITPGGHVSIPADDPGLVLIYVEAGTVTGSSTTPTQIMRVAALATPEANPFESVEAGVEFVIGTGDSFVGEPNAGGNFRNDGSDEVVLLISGLQTDTSGGATT